MLHVFAVGHLLRLYLLIKRPINPLIPKILHPHKGGDGLGDLNVLDDLLVEQLASVAVGEDGDVHAGVVAAVVAEAPVPRGEEPARFMVGGDHHEGVGIIYPTWIRFRHHPRNISTHPTADRIRMGKETVGIDRTARGKLSKKAGLT